MSPAEFAKQVRWLASGSVKVVSVSELLFGNADSRSVALTFDDAFANFATSAWPVLREHAMPVTLFVPTHHVGKANSWEATPGGSMPTLNLLGWDALSELVDEGVSLGAHSRTHPDLRKVDAALLHDEIAGSFEDITRETGHVGEGFAYPYGYFNDRVVDEVRVECRWACTTELRSLGSGDDVFRIPRLDAYFLRGPGAIEGFGSPIFRSYMTMRAAIRSIRSQ